MFENIKKIFVKNDVSVDNVKNIDYGYFNMADGTGTDRAFDSYSSRRNVPYLSYTTIDALYRTNWMARKIVDTPASDMTRRWRTFVHQDSEVINKRERAEKRLGVQDIVRKAIQWGDLYGGSAITLTIEGQEDMSKPVDFKSIKKGSLVNLEVVFKDQITPVSATNLDPYSKQYEVPEYYYIAGSDKAQIHESRIIQFYGSELPLYSLLRQNSWGDSKLTSAWGILEIAEKTWLNVSQLISKSTVDVIQIEDYLNMLAQDATLLTRVVGFQKDMISNYKTMIIDTKDKFERNELSGISSLSNIMIQFLQMVAGAAGMPLSKFLGTSVGGFSVGDNEVQEYYDSISERQNRIVSQMNTLDRIIEISTFGEYKGIDFDWNSLQEMTEEQIADLQLKKAQRDETNLRMGVVDEAMIAESLMLDGTYPSINQEWVEELKDAPVEPDDSFDDYNENEK